FLERNPGRHRNGIERGRYNLVRPLRSNRDRPGHSPVSPRGRRVEGVLATVGSYRVHDGPLFLLAFGALAADFVGDASKGLRSLPPFWKGGSEPTVYLGQLLVCHLLKQLLYFSERRRRGESGMGKRLPNGFILPERGPVLIQFL